MVGETQRILRLRRVDRAAFAQLDDHDALAATGAPARLGDADRFTTNLADLAPRRNRFGGERTLAVDRTRLHRDCEFCGSAGRPLTRGGASTAGAGWRETGRSCGICELCRAACVTLRALRPATGPRSPCFS